MAKYINRKQLINASDEDILEFYSETIFHGVFSTEIKSVKNASYYKGSISNITLDGNLSNLCPSFLNVPTNSDVIPEGPCTFKCRINIDALRGEDHKYIVTLISRSLRASQHEVTVVKPQDTNEQDLFEMWGVEDCQFIGYYHYDEEADTNVIDDIRKPNFDHIPFYPNDNEEKPIKLSFPFDLHRLKKDEYYLFHWKLSKRKKFNPYEIILDLDAHQPQKIDPKWFIDTLFDDRHNDKSKNFGSATNFLDTLSKQLSAKESTFIYELLQNANDYPVGGKMVDVEFNITENYLLFMHTGDKFNVRNISGICGINEKEKVANKKAIGYKGIGFKTVFLNNHYVYLRTGQYSFRFDEKATKIKRLKAPWPILPVWTDYSELSPEINDAFNSSSKDFRVQIALRPDDNRLLHVGKNCYENLFKKVFADSNIILFIPNINSVKVVIGGKEVSLCQRNNEEWVVNDYEKDIDYDLQALINKTIDTGRSRIPEKYKDFDTTRVSFACKHEGSIIKPIEDAILYCYLPTKASWGFPFLMNSDMIPKGDRNDIETEVLLLDDETNFNEELTSIAGEKLFYWLLELLASRKYELGSVFSLVPNFDKCIKEHGDYKDYILKFKDSFEKVLDKKNIVPVKKGIANVNYIVYDTIGLTTSGIMTDEEFLEFADLEDVYLPLPILRSNKSFNRFLKNYAKKDLTFTVEDLHEMIENEQFQEWLKVQENNDKFLNFLLVNDLLDDFMNEKIFIEDECGKLYCAKDLYYNVDEHLVDLKAFTKHIYYLSLKTRKYFQNNEEWNSIIKDHFASFDPEDFVIDTLLSSTNKKETVEELKKEESSLHFYLFLAKNAIINDIIKSLPFITTSNEVVSDFENKFVFFASTNGEKISKSEWLSNISIEFISTKYDKIVQEYFKSNLGVLTYSDDIIAKDMILSDDYCNEIQEAINEDYTISEDFVKFCFNNKNLFTSGTLSNYALNVVDKDGNYSFIIPKDDEVFMPSSLYDSCSEKEWIDKGWMYSLDNDYIQNCSNSKIDEFKKFMDSAFWVKEITAKDFYKYVVKNHIKDINRNISGDKDADGSKNIDFIKYLDDNYKLIFEEEKDENLFSSITLVSEDNCDIRNTSRIIYAFNSELKDILNREWFPSEIAHICSNAYGNSKAILAIRAEKYDFAGFFSHVIAPEIPTINKKITKKEESIDFHNLVIEHKGQTPADEIKKMKSARIYLLGNATPVDSSTGHAILSSTAKELSEKGLVEFSQLNIIDPAYNAEANRDYWSINLENGDFTISHFLKWLNDNTETFATTISDEAKNLSFWRWSKKNLSETARTNLPELPILLTDDTTAKISEVIYLADSYIQDGGIEGYVRKFDAAANFISSKYVQEDDDIEEWQNFWISVGIKSEIIDILIGTIIPKLDEIDEPTLPATLVKYRDQLEEEYEDFPAALTKLRVKAHDGNYYNLSNCIYVNCTEQNEPFAYIEIPNQITFSTGEERTLIKEILQKLNVKFIDNTTEWRHVKISSYLKIQNDLTRRIQFNAIHFAFMDELAVLRETAIDTLGEYNELEKVLVLDDKGEYIDAKTLTMSSIYNPFCDFQKNGITSIVFTSDSYNTNCKNYVGKVMRSLGVHCDFRKGDIQHLTNREFSYYFWTKYLQGKADKDSLDKIAEYISSKEFSETACVPTKDYMRKPSDLYSPAISNYVKKTEDWVNKLPLESIQEIKYKDKTMFDLLPFKKGLSFSDSLYALFSVNGKETRPTIVRWAIEDYHEDDEQKVDEYREDEGALWTNTKNTRVSIKSLYALEKGNATLGQYFNDLDRILNPDYINITDFTKACEVFKIKTITDADLIVDPNNAVNVNRNLKQRLRISALVMAGRYDIDTWSETYKKYDELIEQMNLLRCTAISLQYKDDSEISQSLKKFYFKKETKEFFYVQDIDAKLVFNDFVAAFLRYLDVPTDFSKDIINEIMNDEISALNMITNDLKLNEEFMNQLDVIVPGKKREMVGVEANDNDDLDDSKRHIYTARPVFDDTALANEDNGTADSSPQLTTINAHASQQTPTQNVQEEDEELYDILSDIEEKDDEERKAIDEESLNLSPDDFSHITKMTYKYEGQIQETVCEHYRSGTYVRGHWRGDVWVNGYWRDGSTISEHSRTANMENWSGSLTHTTGVSESAIDNEHYNENNCNHKGDKTDTSSKDYNRSHTESHPRTPRGLSNYKPRESTEGKPYTDMRGWDGPRGNYTPSAPKPYSPDDVCNFGSHGVTRTLEILEPTTSEIDEINRILGEDLSSEQVADQNYLAQLRLYNNLVKRGMTPDESKVDFIRNAHMKNEHTIGGGKYIHKCSAAGGIMYLSPAIWNKIADDRCVVCVYLGAKSNEFMYFNSIDDILKWIDEDDIVIKLTGAEKANAVEELYSGVLRGVKGTAYTLVRINSNEKYNSLFAQLPSNEINNSEEDEDEY